MATYTRTTWVNDQAPAINDTNLNNLENGMDGLYNEFDANTILKADADNTPIKLTVAASTFLGRKAAGNIAAMTVAEAKTLLAIVKADISDFSHGADKHTDRTVKKSIPFSPHTVGATLGTAGYYPAVILDADDEAAYMEAFQFPTDYVSNAEIFMVIVPSSTGNLIVDVYGQWAENGESYLTNYDVHLDETHACTANNMTILSLNIDFASPDVGSSPTINDVLGVKLLQDTGINFKLLGFLLSYTADQ